jgi:secreted trypsin-like serine protease
VSGQKAPEQTQLIVGGSSRERGLFPWHVAIYINEDVIVCGGSLLSERVVLTGEPPTIVECSLENSISSCTVCNTF